MYPVDYNGVRVLTTEQLSQAYECDIHSIQKNFNSNKDRFEEGKHYYKLDGEELKNFKASLGSSPIVNNLKFTSQLILWTRRGASRHCKMLGTEKAWEMYDNLEENYFNPRPSKELTGRELMAKALIEAQAVLAEKDKRIEEMRPKEIFADAVSASKTSVLVRDLAKVIKQNGVDIGQNRLFDWLRENGYLIKGGSDRNMPTQRAMNMKLFEIKVGTHTNGDGVNVTTRTTKVTGKGQVYFVNKFLSGSKPLLN